MSRPSKREAATAHHEAGHAVVGVVQRTGVTIVSIVPNHETGIVGHTKNRRLERTFLPEDGRDPRDVRRRLEPHILAAWAGVLAERKYDGRRHNWDGARIDLEDIAEMVHFCVKGERQERKYGEFLRVEAEDLVAFVWPQVEAVTAALLSHRTLRRPAILEAMRGSALPGPRALVPARPDDDRIGTVQEER